MSGARTRRSLSTLRCARREYADLEQFLGGLARYFNHGLRPGHFLTAVLENDLKGALSRADAGAAGALPRLVQLLVNRVPAVAWGNPDFVASWLAREWVRE